MKLSFIGKPGSGKGTQAKILAEKLNIPHISTGRLFRHSTGELGKLVHSYINGGGFVPDNLTIKILKQRISEKDCEEGFILDGFPRTLPQTEILEKEIKIDSFIEVYISDEEAIKRMSGRRICRKCDLAYNIYTAYSPKKEDICDKCGNKLFQREDQTEEAIKKRIEIHYIEVEPILEKFKPIRINGEQEIEKVTEDILKILK